MPVRLLILTLLVAFIVPAGRACADPVPVVAPWTDTYQGRKYEHLSRTEAEQNIKAESGETAAALDGEDNDGLAAPEAKNASDVQSNVSAAKKGGTRSALEKMYAQRLKGDLPQFGYDMFGVPADTTQTQMDKAAAGNVLTPMGEVQDDFILSSGDELEVVFTGQRTGRALYKVDSKGLLLIPDFPPVPAAGRSIGQVRISVDAAAANLLNTQAYVSLSTVRQIGVLVIGHVKMPGRQTLTVFHTLLDALMAAGGVQKTGSLRQIKLVRDGRSMMIDLYALLLHGSTAMDLRLRDGDRLIVPAIGPTVAIAGEVKRPGIYEILPAVNGMYHKAGSRSEKLSLDEMLELGGGVLAPGHNRYLKLGITEDGEEKTQDIQEDAREAFDPVFGDGSALLVAKGQEKRKGSVELQGETRRPGLYSLAENKTLTALLSSEDILGADIYPLIGVIERRDDDQLASQLIDFPLRLVLKGQYDRKLVDGDIVHLFSMRQISVLDDEQPGNKNEITDDLPSDIIDGVMAGFLKERSAFVRGAVRTPGLYPVAEGATLDSVLAAAGGLALEANTANIEVTSALQGEGLQTNGRSGTRRIKVDFHETAPNEVPIGAGDAVRVNQKFHKISDRSVLVVGEVRNPGRYDLIPGDKLSDLLARAGGLTEQAYADGAIFSRESERRAEEARFHAQAQQMKTSIAAVLEKEDQKIDTGKIQEARTLAAELENAQGVGRITVEANPEVLKAKPELDMLLEEGDRLFIPRRSLTVRVSGEVLSPASLQFRESKKPRDYIQEAGGFTFDADVDRTFVLYPDGSAQPLQVGSWNYNPIFVPPGSTIVVPRDPKPFDFIESAKDISQILSNLAITSIFVDDVRNN